MRVFLVIPVLLLSFISRSQSGEKGTIRFAVTCSAGAYTSPEIEDFKLLNEQKDYKTIRSKLFAENWKEQVLSAILLKHYSSTGRIELSKQELEKVHQIAKSGKRFFFCFTCSFSEEGTLKQLFAGKYQVVYDILQGTMLKTFKHN